MFATSLLLAITKKITSAIKGAYKMIEAEEFVCLVNAYVAMKMLKEVK